MYVHGTDMSVHIPILKTFFTASSLYTTVGSLLYVSLQYSESFAALKAFQNHYFHPNKVYTSTYTYIQCTDNVITGMFFVHNHTSLPIRPEQPCYATIIQCITCHTMYTQCIYTFKPPCLMLQTGICIFVHRGFI